MTKNRYPINPILLAAMIFIMFITVVSAQSVQLTKNFITDDANIIDFSYEQKISELSTVIEQKTTVEIAVVTVSSLEGVPIDMYAVELFEKSGVGKKDKDNGLLLVIAPNEREYRFEVGYGLEGTLPDITAREIGKNVLEPNFRDGEYGKGIYEALMVIDGYVSNNEEVISTYKSSYNQQQVSRLISNNIFWIFLALFILSAIINNKKGRRGGIYPIILPGFGGGFNGGGFGGGFGGFGGGLSGGGGFSGRW